LRFLRNLRSKTLGNYMHNHKKSNFHNKKKFLFEESVSTKAPCSCYMAYTPLRGVFHYSDLKTPTGGYERKIAPPTFVSTN
jgi:hypothetical protein